MPKSVGEEEESDEPIELSTPASTPASTPSSAETTKKRKRPSPSSDLVDMASTLGQALVEAAQIKMKSKGSGDDDGLRSSINETNALLRESIQQSNTATNAMLEMLKTFKGN